MLENPGLAHKSRISGLGAKFPSDFQDLRTIDFQGLVSEDYSSP